MDDVWRSSHVEPFLQGAPTCTRLVTTRKLSVLPEGAKAVTVDAMQMSEAVALLGSGLPAGQEEPLRELAADVGEWPLLLGILNGVLRDRVRRGQSLPQAMSYVRQGLKRGLTTFDKRARERAVSLTVGVGLGQLTPDEQTRFRDLAIFPEDAVVPLGTVALLWEQTARMDEWDTEALCERLRDLSLLQQWDLSSRTVRLHDVIRRFLIGGEGEAEPALHAALLAGYATQCADGWPSGPDDGYFFENLAYHLHHAGRAEELDALLLDFRWMEAKLRHTSVLSLLADYDGAGDPAARRVGRTLRQAAHILAGAPEQLAGQLWGRLLDDENEARAAASYSRARRRRQGRGCSPAFQPFRASKRCSTRSRGTAPVSGAWR